MFKLVQVFIQKNHEKLIMVFKSSVSLKELPLFDLQTTIILFGYHPFHKTLPISSAFVNWISVRFYETDCSRKWFHLKIISAAKYTMI